jgi:hypothetical protein
MKKSFVSISTRASASFKAVSMSIRVPFVDPFYMDGSPVNRDSFAYIIQWERVPTSMPTNAQNGIAVFFATSSIT